MALPAEAKRPSLDLIISLLATKTPDQTRFPCLNESPIPLPFQLPPSLPSESLSLGYQLHFRTCVYGVLDVLSRAVLTDCKQVAAVAASVAAPCTGSDIHTTVHMSLNPGKGLPTEDQMTVRIRDIVRDLKMLTDPEMINASESPMMEPHSPEFMAAFYKHGWQRFLHYYNKRVKRLLGARQLLGQFKVEHAKNPAFEPKDVEHIDFTLWWLERLGGIMQMSDEEVRSMLAAVAIGELYERLEGLIDRGDMSITDLFMAYTTFEQYLKSKNKFIPIIRWVTKLCSLHIDARRLIALATSLRFRHILFGDLDIEIYCQEAPLKQSIKCNDKILLETVAYLRQKFKPSDGQGKDEQKTRTDRDIVEKLKPILAREWRKYFNPSTCVHCEVFLLRRIQTMGVSILPYIGVSKLSCVPCSVFFELQGAAGFHPVSTKGSRGKVYPGWSFPSSGGVDAGDAARLSDLRTMVTNQLEGLLREYVDVMRCSPRNSDSSVGSKHSSVKGLIAYRKDLSSEYQGMMAGVFAIEEWAAESAVPE